MHRLIARVTVLFIASAAALVVPLATADPALAYADCYRGWRQAAIFHAVDIDGNPRPGITFRIMTDEVHSQLKVTRDTNFANVKHLESYVSEWEPGAPLPQEIDQLLAPQAPGTSFCSKYNKAGTALFVMVRFYWPGDNGTRYGACLLYPGSTPPQFC
jgi:hypothetical protein